MKFGVASPVQAPDPMSPLILKRAAASRSSGQWREDDFDKPGPHPLVN
jgi:hypothetical protein